MGNKIFLKSYSCLNFFLQIAVAGSRGSVLVKKTSNKNLLDCSSRLRSISRARFADSLSC